MRSLGFVILIAAALIPYQASPQAGQIVIDGEFSDWDDLTPACTDQAGDQTSGGIDFGRVWTSYDEQYVFISLEVGAEINLQASNQITMYIDTDGSSRTGTEVYGIGAELEWIFGLRSGYLKQGLVRLPVRHGDIGIVSAPTVTSTRFEVAIDRRGGLVSNRSRFPSPLWKIVIADETGGDRIPDSGKWITLTFDKAPLESLRSTGLAKFDRNHVRVLSYNVLWDGLFDADPTRKQAFAAILRAINPDIMGFEEIFLHGAAETKAVIQSILPAGFLRGFGRWYTSKPAGVESDVVLVSRYPIIEAHPIGGNAAFLLDLRPWHDSDLLVVVAHPPCCGNETGRQWEIDALMAFIRDTKQPGGALEIEPNTPIVVMGDMNLVGDSRQVKTLVTGDIVNTTEYGAAFSPDWDGSDFTDLLPRHTHLPMTFTWYSPEDYFWPGRLDYFVYSDAVIGVGNNFVLFTPAMPEADLRANRLRADYTTRASDHLPIVCDFVLP